jgi:hypothetical protein
MTAFAPTLEAFFVERLSSQRHASPNTIASYTATKTVGRHDQLKKPVRRTG